MTESTQPTQPTEAKKAAKPAPDPFLAEVMALRQQGEQRPVEKDLIHGYTIIG